MENETYDIFDAKEKSIENLLHEYAIFLSMKIGFYLGSTKKLINKKDLFYLFNITLHTLQKLSKRLEVLTMQLMHKIPMINANPRTTHKGKTMSFSIRLV